MCRIVEGSIDRLINKFTETLAIQRNNLTRVIDERIEQQVRRFSAALTVLNSNDEDTIINYAERIANEIVRIDNTNIVQGDINFDNWIILVEIGNLFTNIPVRWLDIENTEENQNIILNRIRGNNNG